MEIDKDSYNQIVNMIKKVLKYDNLEFEARLCSKNFEESYKLDYYRFQNILNNLIFSTESGGLGYADWSMTTTLDVINKKNDVRLSINDKDSVMLYWLKEDLREKEIDHKFIRKKRMDRVDLHEYNIRLSLASEEKLKDVTSTINILNNEKEIKTYRLKNRYEIVTPDKLFRYDLTD